MTRFAFLISCFLHFSYSLAQPKLQPYWAGMKPFHSPLGVVKAPGLPGFIFIVEQRGKVFMIRDDPKASTRSLLVDLGSVVSQSGSETGLLGLSFHPDFQKNGRLFLSYTQSQGKKLVSRISELKVDDPQNPKIPDPNPKILISVAQPYENHNGGAICFGPDGYLYFSWGDGGSGGDPKGNGQKISSLLGKIHRINVNQSSATKPYSIPSDNPFVSIPGAQPEIFAYGLRNVWQMHFDSKTGKLWAGDVGQNAFEEIDIIEKGKNYGWNIMEATSIYSNVVTTSKLEPPVWFYSQKEGDRSVTGGLVYHGPHSGWQNKYIYGDFMTGRIWILKPGTNENSILVEKSRVQIACFGTNHQNEILVSDYTHGTILKLTP